MAATIASEQGTGRVRWWLGEHSDRIAQAPRPRFVRPLDEGLFLDPCSKKRLQILGLFQGDGIEQSQGQALELEDDARPGRVIMHTDKRCLDGRCLRRQEIRRSHRTRPTAAEISRGADKGTEGEEASDSQTPLSSISNTWAHVATPSTTTTMGAPIARHRLCDKIIVRAIGVRATVPGQFRLHEDKDRRRMGRDTRVRASNQRTRQKRLEGGEVCTQMVRGHRRSVDRAIAALLPHVPLPLATRSWHGCGGKQISAPVGPSSFSYTRGRRHDATEPRSFPPTPHSYPMGWLEWRESVPLANGASSMEGTYAAVGTAALAGLVVANTWPDMQGAIGITYAFASFLYVCSLGE